MKIFLSEMIRHDNKMSYHNNNFSGTNTPLWRMFFAESNVASVVSQCQGVPKNDVLREMNREYQVHEQLIPVVYTRYTLLKKVKQMNSSVVRRIVDGFTAAADFKRLHELESEDPMWAANEVFALSRITDSHRRTPPAPAPGEQPFHYYDTSLRFW